MRTAPALLAVPLVLAASACGDLCLEPGYAGAATDEAYLALRDAEKQAVADDARAALLSLPAADAQLSLSGAAPTFEWSSGLTARAAAPAPPAAPGRFRWAELFLSSAWAHGAPMGGVGHLVRLKAPGVACPVMHFTSRSTWTVASPEWARLSSAQGKTLAVELTSAWFANNRVVEGPYLPTSQAAFGLVK